LEEVPQIWPTNVIHYKLDDNFTDREKKLIRRAFSEFHAKTNVRWQPHTFQKDYVFIRHGPSACFADLGYLGGKQEVELSSRCVSQHGRICHELMHSLGFDHEQCRSDRDRFVTVNWRNITKGYEDQFAMRHCLAEFLPYDYHSVMHYNAAAFAQDPSMPTIIPRDRTALKRIGQRVKISRWDAYKINTIYTPQGPDKNAQMRKLGASASASADSITEAYHPRQQPEVHVGYSKPGLFADLPVKTEHCRKRGQAVPSVLELGRAARMKRSVIPEELLGSDEMPSFYAPVKKQNFTLKKRALMDDTDMTNEGQTEQKLVFREALRVKRATSSKNTDSGERILMNWIRQKFKRRWSMPSLPPTYFPVNGI
jgi:hypothetical protein